MRMTVLAGSVLAALLLGLVPAGVVRADDKKPVLEKEDKLTEDDPKDTVRTMSYAKTYKVKLKGKQAYRIDVVGKQREHDPYLRVEDSKGKQLAEDDDGGEGLNSRLVFTPKEDGEYRMIVTTFPPKQLIEYKITVKAAAAGEAKEGKLRELLTLPDEERKEVIAAFAKKLHAEMTAPNVRLLFEAIDKLENADSPKAGTVLRELAKPFADSDNAKLAKLGKTLEGTARRIELPGKELEVKGTTLEGKDFDWKKYRGKVVLVDFWASWCGPCKAEFPRMKKLHEQYKEKGFEIVGISIDRSKTALEKYLDDNKLPWISLYDDNHPMAEQYGVNAIPLCILVDRQGRVISLRARGAELERLLEKHVGDGKDSK